MVKFFKDGDRMAIATDAKDENEFIYEISQLLDEMIDKKLHENDWQFQFQIWIPFIVNICNHYKGNKSPYVILKRNNLVYSGTEESDLEAIFIDGYSMIVGIYNKVG